MKGWRTIAFNTIGGLVEMANLAGMQDIVGPHTVAIVLAFGNWVLRYYTTTPIGQKI